MNHLATHPVHLGLGAKVVPQPEFAGMAWYEAYSERTADDGAEGRLVALHEFFESWTSWEVHPAGDELVVCVEGAITLIQGLAEERLHIETLGPGQYAINPAGILSPSTPRCCSSPPDRIHSTARAELAVSCMGHARVTIHHKSRALRHTCATIRR